MSDTKQTWQSYFLTVAATVILTLGGSCYTQLDSRVEAQANLNANHEARLVKLETTLELELKRVNEKLDAIQALLRDYSGTR